MNISSTISDIEDISDDDDSDYEANEETLLETYTTPLDEEDCEVDEYMAFKQVMTGMYNNFSLKNDYSPFFYSFKNTRTRLV